MPELREPGGFTSLEVTVDDAIATVTLNRPDKRNALTVDLLAELADVAGWLDTATGIKLAILRGAGPAFCAGADLGSFATALGEAADYGARHDLADLGRRAVQAFASTRPLTVAAIHGHCVGGGLLLAAACDLRVAAADTRFHIPEVDLGIPLAWGGVPRLVREIGPAATKELVLTCRPFGADEAKGLGLLNRVVDPGELDREVTELAGRLAGQSTYSLELTKRQVNAVAEEAGATTFSEGDADALLNALADPESVARMRRPLEGRSSRRPFRPAGNGGNAHR